MAYIVALFGNRPRAPPFAVLVSVLMDGWLVVNSLPVDLKCVKCFGVGCWWIYEVWGNNRDEIRNAKAQRRKEWLFLDSRTLGKKVGQILPG